MRISHNVMALNTWRNLNETSGALSKTLERLSSGLRINRAADDAAGLAISEKMRAQIRGLNQAIRNAQDTISLIQTGEGALNEQHAILQRLRELAVQAGNDTTTTEDRQAIQDEVNQLIKELNRIANTTQFNTQRLLDGSFSKKQFQIGANAGQTITLDINDMRATKLGAKYGDGQAIKGANLASLQDISINGIAIDLSQATTVQDVIDAINAKTNMTGVTASQVEKTVVNAGTFTAPDGTNATTATVTINGVAITVTSTDTLDTFLGKINAESARTGVTAARDSSNNIILTDASGGPITVKDDGTTNVFSVIGTTDETYYAALRLSTNVGGSITVTGTDVNNLGLSGVTYADHAVNDLDMSSAAKANEGLVTIDFAIQYVSRERSNLGALQNRLEHTVANLSVASENLTAAESRIRDADMAQEMMNFVRQQILLQSGTAMLAQANAVPQSVLQLLA